MKFAKTPLPEGVTAKERQFANAHCKRLLSIGTSAIGDDRKRNRPREATRHTVEGLHSFFDRMGKRSVAVLAGREGQAIADFCTQAQENIETENWLRDRGQMMVLAARGDKDAQVELAEIVRFSVSNILRGHANWSAFFALESLGDAEVPYMEFSSPREIGVETMGEDGGLRTVQADLQRSQYLCKLMYLWSDEFQYPLVNLYDGDLRAAALATIDAARDLAHKINAMSGAYLIAGGASSRIGAFTLDGSEQASYLPHSSIDTSNLPTTNLLIPSSGNSTTSLLRKEVFDLAIKYVTRWGTGAFEDGDLSIAAIHVASGNSTDWLEQVSLSSESNFLVNQIFEGGAVVSYGGHKFAVVSDNTIPATGAGYAYIRTNKPVGKQFEKTGLDRVDAEEKIRGNKGTYSEGKVVGWGFAKPMDVNIAAVKYRDA